MKDTKEKKAQQGNGEEEKGKKKSRVNELLYRPSEFEI
jgi:hypothetical protein